LRFSVSLGTAFRAICIYSKLVLGTPEFSIKKEIILSLAPVIVVTV